ncbi:MAG: sugar-binding protein [Planctomycetota bacterium]
MKAAAMRKVTVALLAAGIGMLIIGQPAHGHTGVHARCVRTDKPVTLDGKLTEWQKAETIEIDHAKTSFGVTSSDADASYMLGTMWDENNLYVAIFVKDSKIVTDQKGEDLYKADCIEIAIDLDNQSEGSYQKDDYQFVFCPSGPDKRPQKWMYRNPVTGNQEPKDVQVASVLKDDGYVLEIAIPWKALGEFRPAAGTVIGFQHDIRDYDANEEAAGLCWSPSKDPMANPLEWGDLILVDRPGAPIDDALAKLKPINARYRRMLTGLVAEDDNEVAVEIADKPVGNLSLGIGWNWRYLSNDFPDWSKEEWDAFLGMLAWTRPHWVRYGLHLRDWEPKNDDNDSKHFAWENFSFDSDAMKMHYRMLDFCEAQGIAVLICNWKAGEWLAETAHSKDLKDTDDKPDTDAPYDPNEFIESIAALVHQLKVVKKYQCVKQISLWNEPNGKWSYNSPNANYPDAFWAMYPPLDAKLKDMDLRDQIQILGPDSSMGKYSELETILPLLDKAGDVIDVVCDHDYKGFMDCEKGKKGVPLSEGIAAYAKFTEALRARKRPLPFGVAEFGNYGNSAGPVDTDEEVFAGSISTAELVTRGAAAGVNGFLRWEFRVYDNSWRNFGALTSVSKDRLFTPYPPVYFPHALLSRHIERGSDVLDVKTAGGKDENGVPRVHASAFKWGLNKFSIVLINDGLKPKVVHVSAMPLAFMRFQLSHLSYDRSLPETILRNANVPVHQGSFDVGLKPRSINVITTIEDGIEPQDFMAPVRLSPPRLEPSYEQGEENGRPIERVRFGFEQGGQWAVWQSSPGRTTLRSADEMPRSGKRSGRLAYEFVSEKPLKAMEHAFVRTNILLGGRPVRMSLWVFGNESGHILHVNFIDANGETYQVKKEIPIDFAGWRKVEIDLSAMPADCGRWGGDENGKLDLPIRAFAVSFGEKAHEFAGTGTIFLDDIEIVAEAKP